MTEDEIRKLLGGYSTDALSAEERKRLFESALEDQKLFDALEDEDALRELLQDPVVRSQARQALEIAGRRRSYFSWQRWAVGVAVPAVIAVIVIAVMKRPSEPPPVASKAIAPSEKVAAPSPPEPKIEAKKLQRVPAVARPRQAPSPQSAISLAAPASRSFAAIAPPPLPEDVRQQFSPQLAVDGPLYQGPLVQFTVKRLNGETVGVEVTVGITGYLALYHIDATGDARRVYPENDVATPIAAGGTIQLPSAPIKMVDPGEKLRLVVVPAAQPASNGIVGGVATGLLLRSSILPPAPFVVDLPLAPPH